MGWVAVGLAAAVVLVAVVLGIRSIPDAQRYLKMRRM
ncbi:hypothetical protein MELE44368_10535 [Mycolicibacterium elephantis DSM 44368]|uniref:Uncharacterized protein n=1 Tax=Mycolicibacterium elephantis DSM 44368 TaxID=1335622 RepID=A0A439DZA4_9MYCO|nr:hypothetical protein MELE44368_10535 [Mycolicibacterium elephantis DSM 44368]